MTLLVPDTEIEEDLASVLDGADAEVKAELDAEELTQGLPKEQQKVELDLEDAPFLDDDEDEEEEEEAEEEQVSLEEPEPDDGKPVWFKNKKIVIPAAAGLLLLIVALVAYLLLSPSPEQTAEPAPETTAVESEMPPPPEPEEPEVQEYLVPLAPFWVEQKQEDAIRFLVCQFTAVTTNEKLSFEITQKTTILRDAIYYYLRNKDLTFLSDKKNAQALKSDVLSVVNQYLSVDRLEQLLIEQYLVK